MIHQNIYCSTSHKTPLGIAAMLHVGVIIKRTQEVQDTWYDIAAVRVFVLRYEYVLCVALIILYPRIYCQVQ